MWNILMILVGIFGGYFLIADLIQSFDFIMFLITSFVCLTAMIVAK